MKIITILASLAIATSCFADNSTAFKIVKFLDTPIFATPIDSSLNEKEMRSELERRRIVLDKAEHQMADLLEKEMTEEELRKTLEFLSSTAGNKFFLTINGKKSLDIINDSME
jgi:hypothetical protein